MTPKQPPPPPPRPPRPSATQAPASNREKMKDAVNELMQQVKDDKAANRADIARAKQREKQKGRKRILQALVLFAGLVASSVIGYRTYTQPFPPPKGEEAIHSGRKSLVFAAALVNQYQQRTGNLPATIAQLGVPLPGIVYQRSGDKFVLSVTVEGRPVTYHSDEDPRAFLNAP